MFVNFNEIIDFLKEKSGLKFETVVSNFSEKFKIEPKKAREIVKIYLGVTRFSCEY